jgi:hypothetical protein
MLFDKSVYSHLELTLTWDFPHLDPAAARTTQNRNYQEPETTKELEIQRTGANKDLAVPRSWRTNRKLE